MRNVFRYLRLAAVLAIIFNFGLFVNRLNFAWCFKSWNLIYKPYMVTIVLPFLLIVTFVKQTWDIWIVLVKYEDWHLCLSHISRGDRSESPWWCMVIMIAMKKWQFYDYDHPYPSCGNRLDYGLMCQMPFLGGNVFMFGTAMSSRKGVPRRKR